MARPLSFSIIFRILLGGLLITSGLPAASADHSLVSESLPLELEDIMGSPAYNHSFWGLLVKDLDSNETLLSINPDKMFVPASTTKLFTVAAALDTLGADYRFQTPVYAQGDIDSSGRLKGDLILVASGDLTMGGRTTADGKIVYTNGDHTYANYGRQTNLTPTDPLAGLKELSRQVSASGIKEVDGDVIIDDSLFTAYQPPMQSPLDQYTVSPIMINDNLIDLEILPGDPGKNATLNWQPKIDSYKVTSKVKTVAANDSQKLWYTSYFSDDGSANITIWGEVPAQSEPAVRVIPVPDPASFARAMFVDVLKKTQSIILNASADALNPSTKLPEMSEYSKLRRVALLKSPPFSENADLILKVSHNLHADTLIPLMAVKEDKNTFEEGLEVEKEFLARAGVDLNSVSFSDGSGGSQADRVTPAAVLQLLRYMFTQEGFSTYLNAMRVMILTNNSTKEDMGLAQGQLRYKGGDMQFYDSLNQRTLLTSIGLGGYMRTSSGRNVTLALYLNSASGDNIYGTAQNDIKRICEIICRSY